MSVGEHVIVDTHTPYKYLPHPPCRTPGHAARSPLFKTSHKFHAYVDDGVKKIMPVCAGCAHAFQNEFREPIQTSPWTQAILEQYYVQEVMES